MALHPTSRLLPALALLALPLAGLAQERSRPAPPERADRASPPPAAPPVAADARPAPPPPDGTSAARPPPPSQDGSGGARPPPPGGRPPPVYPGYPGYPPGAAPPPYWWGWGWGWSYQPVWGWGWWAPPPPPGAAPPPAPPADRVVATLFGSAVSGGGTGGSFGFASEGHRSGFRVAVDGFSPDRIDGARRLPGTDPLAYGVITGSWSPVSTESGRLRVELGGSMLAMGSTGSSAGKPYAGTTALGVVAGTSGQLGLVGPLGVEGHLRVTPYPVVVVDAGAGLVLRFGPAAVSAGWRLLDVQGRADKGPDARLSGPELGLVFAF